MKAPSICIVGQMLVDVFLPTANQPGYRVRLGGVAHASRALCALDCPHGIAHFSPEYLREQIQEYGRAFGLASITPVGRVIGSPNVILVGEPKEIGDQGYQYLLRDEQQLDVDRAALRDFFVKGGWDDALLFPSTIDFAPSIEALTSTANHTSVHADMNFIPVPAWSELRCLGSQMETMILSTSSKAFLEDFGGSAAAYRSSVIPTIAQRALLKENRGGSRFFGVGETLINTAAQPRTVVHSVGVGDCFDAVYVALRRDVGERAALAYAACIASEYAATIDMTQFRESAHSWLRVPANEIVELVGVSLPWEDRPQHHIYIAAPDFDYVDTRAIDNLEASLRYHNFTPRRPVQEHGQMRGMASPIRRQELCDADLRMLSECSIMVAVNVHDDPGTLIEIGMAVGRGMPVIVYDPARRAQNLMLTQLPDLVSSDLDAVISYVFSTVQRLPRK